MMPRALAGAGGPVLGLFFVTATFGALINLQFPITIRAILCGRINYLQAQVWHAGFFFMLVVAGVGTQ